MSELNGSGGGRKIPDAASPWPVPAAQQPIKAGGHAGEGGHGRSDHDLVEAQPWDIVERLRQMADLIGDALAAGERKVAEAHNDAQNQVAAMQAEKEAAQRDAAAAWGEVQRARGQAEEADRRALEAERRLAEAQN
ncbi:hypothetical protein, partial [Actinomadura rubrobrunea]